MSLTLILVIMTCLVSYRAFNDQQLFRKLLHSPYIETRNKEYYRLITSGFVHGGWVHLLINMFVLFQFGNIIEIRFLDLFGETFGRINYLLLYLLAIVAGDIPTLLKHRNNSYFSSVGASGAVSAILFVYIIFSPWQPIYLYGLIGIPSIIAGLAYLAYSSWASKNSNDRIDHSAHFYGAVFGFVFAIALKPSLFSLFLHNLLNNTPWS